MGNRVLLSVDPNLCLDDGDQEVDLWLVESPANRLLAKDLRNTRRFRSVTVFEGSFDSANDALSILPAIFEHHPEARTIVLRGLSPEATASMIDSAPLGWVGMIEGRDLLLQQIK